MRDLILIFYLSSTTHTCILSQPPVLRASGWVRSQRFPAKLYALLSQPQLSHISLHGCLMVVVGKFLNQESFETSVLPVLFEIDNYHSFNRVINAWSFRRKSTGPDRGSYFHELFFTWETASTKLHETFTKNS